MLSRKQEEGFSPFRYKGKIYCANETSTEFCYETAVVVVGCWFCTNHNYHFHIVTVIWHWLWVHIVVNRHMLIVIVMI